ncbi:hypothetical protein NDU88_006625 [Pleurodeles waltl]|uniref:Uncharacterized protein n=1 Tax=Pleurodeles waltl TaxID=8319 RepID=A0AAV7VS36_PLEWA|nr:hypothetical protein NDU88_006625 [Pleurodeles waltl]
MELPDSKALGTGTNPEVLPGTNGQKKNAARDLSAREDSKEPEKTRTPTETPAGGEEDEDGPTDSRQARRQRGGEDQEAILQDPGHALGRAGPPQGQKKNAGRDWSVQEDNEEPETTRTPKETPAGGEEDEDRPAYGRQAERQRGGEDQEAILQRPRPRSGKSMALTGVWPGLKHDKKGVGKQGGREDAGGITGGCVEKV